MDVRKSKLVGSAIVLLFGIFLIVSAFLPGNSTYNLEETERYATTISYLNYDVEVHRRHSRTYWATFDTEKDRCFVRLSTNFEEREQEKLYLEQLEKTQKEVVVSKIERTYSLFKDSVQVIDIRDDSQVYLSFDNYNDNLVKTKTGSLFGGIFIIFVAFCCCNSEIEELLSAKRRAKKHKYKYKETENKKATRSALGKDFKSRAVICIVLASLITAMPVIIFFGVVWDSHFEESDTTFEKVTFNDWHVSSDTKDLELFSPQFEDEFIIGDYEKYVDNLKELKSDCNGKEVFDVWYIHEDSKHTGSSNTIYQISKDDNIIFSFDDMRSLNKDYLKPCFIFCSAMFLVCLSMVILLSMMLRKPEMFTLRFIRQFIR